jgi:hypothetical protein
MSWQDATWKTTVTHIEMPTTPSSAVCQWLCSPSKCNVGGWDVYVVGWSVLDMASGKLREVLDADFDKRAAEAAAEVSDVMALGRKPPYFEQALTARGYACTEYVSSTDTM